MPDPTGAGLVPVIACDASVESSARQLAARWGLPFTDSAVGFALAWDGERLRLKQMDRPREGAVEVDLVAGAVAHRRLYGGGRGQPIAKAVGLRKGHTPTVLDATAGLGRDAFVLASLGCSVTLVERSPVAAALLEDGLRRAMADPEVAPIAGRMQLRFGDAPTILNALRGNEPAVVYLDPMYPKGSRKAKVKKEMQVFQAIIGADDDADRLLDAALAVAVERVVVKRPDYAPPLAGRAPTLQFATRKNRFDVYVIRALGGGAGQA